MDSRRQDVLALGEWAGERCGKLASLKIQWPSSMQRCGDDDSADKMNGWYVRGGFAALDSLKRFTEYQNHGIHRIHGRSLNLPRLAVSHTARSDGNSTTLAASHFSCILRISWLILRDGFAAVGVRFGIMSANES